MLKRTLLLAALAFAAPAVAQDTPQPPGDPAALLGEATTALGNGEVAAARKAAEKAAQALAVKHGEAIRAILPAAFDGWTINEGDTTNLGLIALGGGVAIDRTYNNADGTDVRIEVMADSDVIEPTASMFSDAAQLAAMGVKTETVNGETAIVDEDGKKLTFFIDKRSSFTVAGSAAPEVVKSYAENINFAAFRVIK
ncbi:hypothetical protein sos41_29980 [Alphaproteobacteria bacterium SO-S41]|nr:hypothetical protein sos41_29980 [Alphaproteobacteria bacterium SO-S41]